MLIFVAALTPGFRRSPPAAKGEARLQLEVGTGTAISNIAEWGGFNVTFIIATWVSIAPTLSRLSAGDGRVLHVLFGIATATSVRGQRPLAAAIRKR